MVPDYLQHDGVMDQQQQGDKNLTVFVGPWGGNGGTAWDDGVYDGVREIRLEYDHCIDSITVIYDKNGKPTRAEKHGGLGGNKTSEVCSSLILSSVSLRFWFP